MVNIGSTGLGGVNPGLVEKGIGGTITPFGQSMMKRQGSVPRPSAGGFVPEPSGVNANSIMAMNSKPLSVQAALAPQKISSPAGPFANQGVDLNASIWKSPQEAMRLNPALIQAKKDAVLSQMPQPAVLSQMPQPQASPPPTQVAAPEMGANWTANPNAAPPPQGMPNPNVRQAPMQAPPTQGPMSFGGQQFQAQGIPRHQPPRQ